MRASLLRVRNTKEVQNAFGTVVVVVTGAGIVIALITLLLSRGTWDAYGKSHLLLDREGYSGAPAGSAAAERETEIRQMLEARNARRRRRGEPEIDVDQELARLTPPPVDAELRQEIRDLVLARNHRRARQGKPPLDVEAEIEREISGLSGL